MFKYIAFLIFPFIGFIALNASGLLSLALILLSFIIIPIIELILPTSPKFLTKEKIELLQQNKGYTYLLYLMVPLQFLMLYFFLTQVSNAPINVFLAIKIITMAILCGTMAINIAHELGHRQSKLAQFFAKSLLLTSLYMHFYIEHNRGHHKNVATANDPATARKNETIYRFIIRCIRMAYLSAWKIENDRLKRSNQSIFSIQNEMVQFTFFQVLFIVLIGLVFGIQGMICFVIAAIFGFILLECIEYIEHYGLIRKEIKPGIYEGVQNKHSWNCNKMLGRILLFELPLHPAHHKNSSVPYQALQSTEDAPEMPLGYPGMILLALVPSLWFKKINPLLAN